MADMNPWSHRRQVYGRVLGDFRLWGACFIAIAVAEWLEVL